MQFSGKSLFGNEWIDYEKTYHRIHIANDGMYRLNYEALLNAGLSPADLQGNQIELWHEGKRVPVYPSTQGPFESDDYVLFRGEKNRGSMDTILYWRHGTGIMNPTYSMYTDTAAYFLTTNEVGGSGTVHYKEESGTASNPDQPWHLKNINRDYLEGFFKKYDPIPGSLNKVYASYFQSGTGYSSKPVNIYNERIPINDLYTTDEVDLDFEMAFLSDYGRHRLNFEVNNEVIASDTFFNDFRFYRLVKRFDSSTLGDTFSINLKGKDNELDRYHIGYYNIDYPAAFSYIEGEINYYSLPAFNEDRHVQIPISNFEATYLVFDATGGELIRARIEDHFIKFNLKAGDAREIVVFQDDDYIDINPQQGLKFAAYHEQKSADYLLITNKKLRKPLDGIDYIEAYKAYRESEVGGGFNVLVVDIDELYDQYIYGVRRHPYAIKNFVNLAALSFDNPQYVFLLGKGRTLTEIRNHGRLNIHHNFQLPSFGFPASDNIMMSASSSNSTPSIPFGRIAARSNKHVKLYLDKVKVYENPINVSANLDERGWYKQILHLAGGSPTDHHTLRSYLRILENTIEDGAIGANVTTIAKHSSEPVQTAISQRVFNEINKGARIVTFFGHSSQNTLDFDIDIPYKYTNKERNAFLIALGCSTGNMNTSSLSVNEQFVFMDSVGFIGSAASVDIGYAGTLREVVDVLYDGLGNEYMNQGIGSAFKHAIQYMEDFGAANHFRQASQFLLHADPALNLIPIVGPDVTIDPKSVSLSENTITSNTDSTRLNFEVYNVGKAQEDKFYKLTIQRSLPNGQVLNVLADSVQLPFYKSAHTYTVPLELINEDVVGFNRFVIKLDVDDDLDEFPKPSAEGNNTLIGGDGKEGFAFYVYGTSAEPLYPRNYEIVNDPDVNLVATASDVFSETAVFEFEIDTTELFSSPELKQSGELSFNNAIGTWSPGHSLQNGVVYYWRVRQIVENSERPSEWQVQSFIYLRESANGFNQSHHFQWLNNFNDGIFYDSLNKDFVFNPSEISIHIQNGLLRTYGNNFYTLDGEIFGLFSATDVRIGFNVIVVDPIKLYPWFNKPGGLYNSINNDGWVGPVRDGYFAFAIDSAHRRKDFMDMIENHIPDGHFVIVSLHNHRDDIYKLEARNWLNDSTIYDKNIFQVLESHGAKEIRNVLDEVFLPYVFCFQKGGPVLGEVLADSLLQFIDFETKMVGRWFEGGHISDIFGPFAKMEGLQTGRINDNNPVDESTLIIYASDDPLALEYNLNEAVPFVQDSDAQIVSDEFQWPDLENNYSVDHLNRSYARLDYISNDTLRRNPKDLNYWRITGQQLPDLVLSLSRSHDIVRKADHGEFINYSFEIYNISTQSIPDSSEFHFAVLGAGDQVVYETYKSVGAFNAFESKIIQIPLASEFLLPGQYRILGEINSGRFINEITFTNNSGYFNLELIPDEINPLLDVTFNGKYIKDLEIVGTNPLIKIRLSDENQFLILDEPDAIEATLIYPDGSTYRLNVSDPDVDFLPATQGANTANWIFSPTLSQAGIYRLSVNAKDESGNNASNLSYNIRFQLIEETAITPVKLYPNPFTDQVQLIYTASGINEEITYNFEVYSMSGSKVWGIDRQESGIISVGSEKTLLIWDGRDYEGSELPSGMYIYRITFYNAEDEIVSILNEQTLETSKGMEQVGKLILLR